MRRVRRLRLHRSGDRVSGAGDGLPVRLDQGNDLVFQVILGLSGHIQDFGILERRLFEIEVDPVPVSVVHRAPVERRRILPVRTRRRCEHFDLCILLRRPEGSLSGNIRYGIGLQFVLSVRKCAGIQVRLVPCAGFPVRAGPCAGFLPLTGCCIYSRFSVRIRACALSRVGIGICSRSGIGGICGRAFCILRSRFSACLLRRAGLRIGFCRFAGLRAGLCRLARSRVRLSGRTFSCAGLCCLIGFLSGLCRPAGLCTGL